VPLRPYLAARSLVLFPTKLPPFRFESARPIRCVIADDHALVRDGVRRLLEDDPDFAVVGEAADASEALKQVLEHRPDLILLDITMPGMSSFEAGRLIGEHCPGTRIVYLTMHEDQEYVFEALRSGASGYLLKDTPAPHLLRALRDVHRGERAVSPQVLAKLTDSVGARNKPSRAQTGRIDLTPREREVMKLLAEGQTVRQTASQLGVSVKTVEAHKLNLMRKLNIHNKAQLVTAAIQKRIISPPLPM
jgi:two-component system, NarL family, response regulator NreC